MSILREILQQRRTFANTAKPPTPPVEESARSVKIHAWNGETWVLPWANFISARHQTGKSDERLVLTFGDHEVEVQGVGLLLLVPKIAASRLDEIGALPPKSGGEVNKVGTVINRVSVRVVVEMGAETS